MRTAWICAIALATLSAPSLLAQQQTAPRFIDVWVVHVKLDKVTEFIEASKKFTEAHTKGNSNQYWVATQRVQGENHVYEFIFLSRNNWSALDAKPNEKELLVKSFGAAEAEMIAKSTWTTIDKGHNYFRRLRPDLSINMEQNDLSRSSVIYSHYVTISPGQRAHFERLIARVNGAHRKLGTSSRYSWSVTAAGGGPQFVATIFVKNFGELDSLTGGADIIDEMVDVVARAFGEEAYRQFTKEVSETVGNVETVVSRIRPEISRPLPEFIKANPQFWQPMPATP